MCVKIGCWVLYVSMIVGQVQCADEELTANDSERVEMTCSLQYGGSADAGWRVGWHRADSEQVLASYGDDSSGNTRQSYLLVAKYKQSDGDYVCSVRSRRSAYHDSCTTSLHVLREFALLSLPLLLLLLFVQLLCIFV